MNEYSQHTNEDKPIELEPAANAIALESNTERLLALAEVKGGTLTYIGRLVMALNGKDNAVHYYLSDGTEYFPKKY